MTNSSKSIVAAAPVSAPPSRPEDAGALEDPDGFILAPAAGLGAPAAPAGQADDTTGPMGAPSPGPENDGEDRGARRAGGEDVLAAALPPAAESEEFAGGENPDPGPTPPPAGVPPRARVRRAAQRPAAPSPDAPRYRERLESLRASGRGMAATEDEAGTRRNGFLTEIAGLVHGQDFDLSTFCSANGLPCTAATRKNPGLAVIQAALPGIDRKHASKLGLAIVWAVGRAGGVGGLPAYLAEHSVEECVRQARAAKPRRPRAPPEPAAPPAPRLEISGAPLLDLSGLVSVTVRFAAGRAHYVSHARADAGLGAPAHPALPCDGGDAGAPRTETAPGGPAAGDLPEARPAAHEIRRSDDGAAGEEPAPGEVPAAA